MIIYIIPPTKKLFHRRHTMNRIFAVLLVSFSLSFGTSKYILDSELRTNFSDNNPSNQFLTAYNYDQDGNRIQQRVWSGADSADSPMSAVRYTYNSSGVITEAIFLTGTDTSSIVRYTYNSDKLVSVRTLTKTGSLRFTDSLIYDESGRDVEEQRISSSGVKTFFHQFSFNSQGKKTADSLYELSSGSYIATRAVLFSYNTDSTVASEVQWELREGKWYCISTALMTYSSGLLVSVATHERDGVGTATTDSLVYSYDTHGNRTAEEEYDGDKSKMHGIVYTWRELTATIASITGRSISDNQFSICRKDGHIFVNCNSSIHGLITIYDIAGKKVRAAEINHSGIVIMNSFYGKGAYVAVFTAGVNRQTVKFTIS